MILSHFYGPFNAAWPKGFVCNTQRTAHEKGSSHILVFTKPTAFGRGPEEVWTDPWLNWLLIV